MEPQDQQAAPAPSVAQQRFATAVEDFTRVARRLPENMPADLPLAEIERGASLDVLLQHMVATGQLDERAFIEAKVNRMAEIVEMITIGTRNAARQATGLVIPGASPR